MDFFEHQEKARKKTFLLVLLFTLGVIGIIGVTYFIFSWVYTYVMLSTTQVNPSFWHPGLFIFVTIATVIVVGFGSLYKMSQLNKGGGAYVAEELGGKTIKPETKDPDEQKVLNIVEEIAIATGIPPPKVYILHNEPGINAFAAGFSPNEAVIGVTEGCIKKLTRDELQGVIAHEFSHILNGDMRLNIRLIGLLFGILLLGVIGYYTLRSSYYARFVRGGSRQQQGGAIALLTLGIGLMAVGFIGTFFGQLIKAAVSRQREFLADASSVQFTRNPNGIGNALKKIQDDAMGSKMKSPIATEVSHMLFSQGFLSGLGSLFATHPPIEERISRIFSIPIKKKSVAKEKMRDAGVEIVGFAPVGSIIEQVSRPSLEHIQYANELMNTVPKPIADAAHEPFGARAVIYGLLLSKNEEIRKSQLDYIQSHVDYAVGRELKKLLPYFEQLDIRTRLPLIELAIPSLTNLSKKQHHIFIENVAGIILTDQRIDLHEWILEKILIWRLKPKYLQKKIKEEGREQLDSHLKDVAALLDVFSFVAHKGPDDFLKAFQAGFKHLGKKVTKRTYIKEIDFNKLDKAVDNLKKLMPQDKKKVLEACLVCMYHDHAITVHEAELFRGIADAIGSPVPLILPKEQVPIS